MRVLIIFIVFLRSKYFPSNFLLKTSSTLVFSLKVRDVTAHPHKATSEISFVYFNFHSFQRVTLSQKILESTVASISGIQFAPNLFKNYDLLLQKVLAQKGNFMYIARPCHS